MISGTCSKCGHKRHWSDGPECKKCGYVEMKALPAAKLILCEECRPACHYLDRCPTHGEPEDESVPETKPAPEPDLSGLAGMWF